MDLITQIITGVAISLLSGAVAWLANDWRTARKARAKGQQQKGLVQEEQCKQCHAEWDAKLAAGDERMDVSAEVDAFVVTWLPAMCEALEMRPVDCQAMKKEATALLAKVLNAGREKRGVNHAR